MDALPRDLADAIDAAAPRLGAFGALQYTPDVDSTNDVVLTLAQSGAPEGTAVLADRQHAGRGRRGRQWFSPPGAGIYLSVLLRPDPAGPLSLLTLAAGVAVARGIRVHTALPVELKWPNDVVIGRPWRKLAGVLCETSGTPAGMDAVVVGIGVNVGLASYPPELMARATSLEAELGRPVDRTAVVVECLASLAGVVGALRGGRSDEVLAEWRRLAHSGLGGAPVRWQADGLERRGLARDIDVDGALLVETRDEPGQRDPVRDDRTASPGRSRWVRLIAGEVEWERLSRD